MQEETITKQEKIKESMEDFEHELEASFRKISEGDIIKGTVVDVGDEEITLDIKYYTPAIIKLENLSNDPSFVASEKIHPGDELSGEVIKMDDGRGNIELSGKQAEQVMAWDKLAELKESQKNVSVTIRESVKGGVVCYLEGVRAFIPASRVSLSYIEDLDTWVGKTVEARVLEINKKKNSVVLSCREILREKREEELNHRIAMLVPGEVVEGTVESIKPYGAFVSLGDGVDGLVHISQLSYKRVESPREVVKEGQKVKVKILNTKDGKVSLSMKALQERPEEDRPDENEGVPIAEYTKETTISTSLGSLLSGIKLEGDKPKADKKQKAEPKKAKAKGEPRAKEEAKAEPKAKEEAKEETK